MSDKNIFTAKKSIIKRVAALIFVLAIAVCLYVPIVFATESSTTTTSDPDADVSVVTVSSNSQETLGTVSFSQSNTKRISVGKSTVLYLTIKDMGYSYATTFETSDETIATIEQIDNRSVKVVGMKNGVVTITATVDSTKGLKVTKCELTVGDADTTSDVTSEEETENNANDGGIITNYDDENIDLDLFSSTDDPMLAAYAKERNNNNATSILLGLIGWVIIIIAIVYVFSVIIRSRTPKMNVSPGSRKRYSTGGSLRSVNRLLPDKYYRNLKKY